MVRLASLETGRQFLREPHQAAQPLPRYGDDFALFDPSGFDECFPTVAPSECFPVGPNGGVLQLPDHGELWSRPWQWEAGPDELELSIAGVQLDYVLTKRVSLSESRLHIDYLLRNRGVTRFPYIWSAHPLLQVTAGARLVLPAEVEQVRVEWASDSALGIRGDHRPWPYLGPDRDYAVVQPPDLRQAVKCFTPALREGWAEVHYPDTGDVLRLRFDREKTPFLGLWLCYGGWPLNQAQGHHTIALEPTNVAADCLATATAQGEAPEIGPRDTATWTLEIGLER
jgi:galactose mutarotase-like enzyme